MSSNSVVSVYFVTYVQNPNCSGLPLHEYNLSKTYFRTYNVDSLGLEIALSKLQKKNPSY